MLDIQLKSIYMNAKSKIGLAVMIAGLLLFNPAGQCAKAAPSATPSHCHKTPVPVPEDCGKAGCVYMNALPLATAVLSDHDSRQFLVGPVVPKPIAEEPLVTTVPAIHGVVFAMHQWFLTIHQLLI